MKREAVQEERQRSAKMQQKVSRLLNSTEIHLKLEGTSEIPQN